MNIENDQDERRWEQIKQRTRDPKERFFYGVKSTGVYCRVGCKSRLPLRKNVCFFQDVFSAEQAGFRACKRCQPRMPAGKPRLAEACLAMEAAGGPVPVVELADLKGFSESQFYRAFRRKFGMSPHKYGRRVREQRLREALESGDSVADAACQALRYTLCGCSLGWLLVATTDKGICAVDLGDSPEELERRLEARFHESRVRVGLECFGSWLEELLESLAVPKSLNHLPLDLKGTVFQRQVWQALREVPPGQTRSYSELAAGIGKPKAYRAVARACGQNTVALLVPCHRVVAVDGSLTGYRWGLERKRRLLETEGSQ